jgi:hypothetical protein
MIRRYIEALYDIDLIQDEKTKDIKIMFLADFIDERLPNLNEVLLSTINGFKAIHEANDKVMIASDEEYQKIITSVDYATFKFKDTIKTKDDVVNFVKQGLQNESIYHTGFRNINDFTMYALATGTEKQTLANFDNRFKENGATSYTDKNKVVITGVFFNNIYTDYDTQTEAGTQNRIKRSDAVEQKYNALWQLIKTKKEPITLDEVAQILSFNDAEAELLKRKKDDLAGLEKLTKTAPTPKNYTFITNKIQNELHTLTDDFTGLTLSSKKNKGTAKAIIVDAKISLDEAIKSTGIINELQKQILNIFKSHFKENPDTPITLQDIYRYLTGGDKTRPKKEILDTIKQSIDTLSNAKIELQYHTSKKYKGTDGYIELTDFKTPLLPIEQATYNYKGTKQIAYKLYGTYEDNKYFKLADQMNQLASVPMKYLNNNKAVQNSIVNISLTSYLVEQINLIKKGSLNTNRISYDRLYEVAGLTDADDSKKTYERKRTIRDTTAKILEEKRKQGLLQYYEVYRGQKNEAKGIAIFFKPITDKGETTK